MSGEGQFREQAKKQWEKLDAEGRKIINDLLISDKDRTVWPENTEPKFTGKKRNKIDKSGIRQPKPRNTCNYTGKKKKYQLKNQSG